MGTWTAAGRRRQRKLISENPEHGVQLGRSQRGGRVPGAGAGRGGEHKGGRVPLGDGPFHRHQTQVLASHGVRLGRQMANAFRDTASPGA